MYFKVFCLLAGVAATTMGTASATVISTYTDRATWEAALTGAVFSEETFDGPASSFSAFSTGNSVGSVTVDLIGGVGDPGPTGLTGTGFFEGEVDSSPIIDSGGLNLRMNHSLFSGFGLLGLQNDSSISAGSLDLQEIGLLVDGSYFLVSDILGLTDSSTATGSISAVENSAPIPFIGFVMDAPISSFLFVHGDQAYAGGVSGATEEFYLDGLVFASSGTQFISNIQSLNNNNNVPEPGTWALVVAGLAGLGVGKRRAKRI